MSQQSMHFRVYLISKMKVRAPSTKFLGDLGASIGMIKIHFSGYFRWCNNFCAPLVWKKIDFWLSFATILPISESLANYQTWRRPMLAVKMNFRGGLLSSLFSYLLPFRSYGRFKKFQKLPKIDPRNQILAFTQKLSVFEGNVRSLTHLNF